jgi:uncharacterized protein YegL
MSIQFTDEQFNRRLPVYLLIDHSGSMAGAKIVQVNQGIQLLYTELMNDPRSAATVNISIIPFESQAYQMDLVPIQQFTAPQFSAGGGTALGAALKLLNDSLDSDLITNQPGQKGDYKPLVFLLTDGQPGDSWQGEAQRLKSRTTGKTANVVALAIGPDADVNMLKQVTDTVLKIEIVDGEILRKFFIWVTASIKVASASAAQGKATVQLQTPPLPQGINLSL